MQKKPKRIKYGKFSKQRLFVKKSLNSNGVPKKKKSTKSKKYHFMCGRIFNKQQNSMQIGGTNSLR